MSFKIFVIIIFEGETTWDIPTSAAVQESSDQVQVRHILKKHNQSRRPASWRCDKITQSKEESISQITGFYNTLQEVFNSQGYDAMHKLFQEIAYQESDCGSHEKGGDLGMFGNIIFHIIIALLFL